MSRLIDYEGQPAYAEYDDEQLIHMIRAGDSDAQDYIIYKYKNMIKVRAHEYFIIGADREDIIQEGMIGFYKAIRDYNTEKAVPFYYFAQLCVKRQIVTAIKAATRQKHMPLNAYVSLNKAACSEDSEKTFIDMLAENRISNPEELFIGREGKSSIESYIREILSDLEYRVLSLHLMGKKYEEMARLISKDEKSIDNALQRARRKIELFLAADLNAQNGATSKKKRKAQPSGAATS